MRLRLLGPLDLVDDSGVSVPVSAPKRRAVLAALALDANRVVSLDRLVAAVRGQHPPPRVRTSLHVHASALRRMLDSQFSLATRSPGYPLVADRVLIDCHEFAVALDSALRIYRSVRASWDITRSTTELSVYGVQSTVVELPPDTGWAALTDTERAIATRLAERRSNTDVATAPHLTRRAVEFHIDRVLDELGCTTRAGIIFYVGRHMSS